MLTVRGAGMILAVEAVLRLNDRIRGERNAFARRTGIWRMRAI